MKLKGSNRVPRDRLMVMCLGPVARLEVVFCPLLVLAFFAFSDSSFAADRMIVEDHMLIYNTDALTEADDDTPEILYQDVNLFGDLLMNNPEVDTIIVSGGGGNTSAAYDMANKISEFRLTTVARNNCSSACAIMFLGGGRRMLESGARLGFHRSSTRANEHKDFFLRNESFAGWSDEFAYADHVFQDGQISARNFVEFAVRRGVDLNFALRALTYSPIDMWYPSEDELVEAGVVLLED